MSNPSELSALPEPQAIEQLTYEQVYNEVLADFQELEPDYQLFLESDPAVKLIEAFAYRELLLRIRINEALRANLLCFATGADLDQLASFYNVFRLTINEEDNILESDEDFRARTFQAIKGSSTAGSKDYYRSVALNSSSLVKDIQVNSPEPGVVDVFVLSSEGNGVPDAALISAVDAVVNSDSVRVITDTVNTQAATERTISVDATIQLLPNAPQDAFDTLEASFTEAFEQAKALGRDITLSWIISTLSPDGIYKVTLNSPTQDEIAAPSEFVNLSGITLTQGSTEE
jgi:phage-related baseplate assembly protein